MNAVQNILSINDLLPNWDLGKSDFWPISLNSPLKKSFNHTLHFDEGSGLVTHQTVILEDKCETQEASYSWFLY